MKGEKKVSRRVIRILLCERQISDLCDGMEIYKSLLRTAQEKNLISFFFLYEQKKKLKLQNEIGSEKKNVNKFHSPKSFSAVFISEKAVCASARMTNELGVRIVAVVFALPLLLNKE